MRELSKRPQTASPLSRSETYANTSKREAILAAYCSRPSTHQLALEAADMNFIRSLSPMRISPERKFDHVHTSVFGGRTHAPAVPRGSDNDWCNKGLVLAGESSTAAIRRLSNPSNYTASYKKMRSFPHTAEISELPKYPRYSHRDLEFLESIKIRKVLAPERRNPEEKGNYTNSALFRQSLRSTY